MSVVAATGALTRRRFLGGLLLAGVATPLHMRFVEPFRLEITRQVVQICPTESGPPLKILHLSDLHVSSSAALDFTQKAVRLGLEMEPDLICLTGDFITKELDQFDRYCQLLGAAARTAPAFACLGNHDGGRWAADAGGYPDTQAVRRLLSKSGIALLHNCGRTVQVRGRSVSLVGLGDLWAREFAPREAFAKIPLRATPLTVVLSHNPDTKNALGPYPWHLLLCGHTHGGQCLLPVLGTPFAPVRDKHYVAGLHLWDGRWLHISRGVGTVYGLRFLCRPQISLLTLT
jgi:uncharacterized protein